MEEECFINSNASGRMVLHFERKRMARRREQKIPDLGSIIIFNEIYMSRTVGRVSKNLRGIGRVESYSGYFVLLSVFRTENFIEKTSIRLDDIRIGLVQYRYLTDFKYTGNYTYEDLDLKNLHPDLKKLLVNV